VVDFNGTQHRRHVGVIVEVELYDGCISVRDERQPSDSCIQIESGFDQIQHKVDLQLGVDWTQVAGYINNNGDVSTNTTSCIQSVK
jgi:hypothetical protein